MELCDSRGHRGLCVSSALRPEATTPKVHPTNASATVFPRTCSRVRSGAESATTTFEGLTRTKSDAPQIELGPWPLRRAASRDVESDRQAPWLDRLSRATVTAADRMGIPGVAATGSAPMYIASLRHSGSQGPHLRQGAGDRRGTSGETGPSPGPGRAIRSTRGAGPRLRRPASGHDGE